MSAFFACAHCNGKNYLLKKYDKREWHRVTGVVGYSVCVATALPIFPLHLGAAVCKQDAAAHQ
jgi:hypothetical protein